ncbi:MAG TPA: hypothetical protein DCQ31_02140, partial [Bacteroidales bacterium]|nr:hypothetical protein [Bacteroidales bacterium]
MIQLKKYFIALVVLCTLPSYIQKKTTFAETGPKNETLLQLAEIQLMRVVNYQTLSNTQKLYWKNRIYTLLEQISNLQKTDENGVLPTDALHIPSHLIRIAQAENEINMIGDLDIAYIPDP